MMRGEHHAFIRLKDAYDAGMERWAALRVKIGAKVVRHARAVTFQLAEVAVPRALFAAILARIGRLRAAPSPG